MADSTPKPEARGLASSSEVGRITRALTSRVMRIAVSPRRQAAMRSLRELRRRSLGAPHEVHYFHQVDDAYSHLAVQALSELCSRYEISLVPHLTAARGGSNLPEPELLRRLAAADARAIAPHYALAFPAGVDVPSAASVALVEQVLAAASPEAFGPLACELGSALWSGDEVRLKEATARCPTASAEEAERAAEAGAALRSKWGHYSGAMFYYAGEWYWGVDRLYHLETRLRGLGVARAGEGGRFPRFGVPTTPVERASELKLEVFPSLRSPYTAVGFQAALDLARGTGVVLDVRPVLPMVMRGVPVTFAKGIYIFADAAREAAALGAPYGRFVDPIGEPVRRGYSLWPWARERGRGSELLAAFLRGAFAEGIDAGTDAGLRRIVEKAGLPWSEAREHLGDTAWEAELEQNRIAMYDEMGLWGVPSFRLTGPDGEPPFCAWGQDRLWLLAREIQRRGAPAGV